MTKTAVAVMAVFGLSALAIGQEQYPARPITIVVPFTAGGPLDAITRIVGDHMSRKLGQRIVIENVAGAGGTIGVTRAAQAAPDGYTLSMGHLGTHGAAPALYSKLKYDPLKHFKPIGLIAEAPTVVVVRKGLRFADMKDFIRLAKEKESALLNAHAGVGSLSHLTCLLFNLTIGIRPTEVPYRGTGPAMSDIIAGQVDYLCDVVVNVVPHLENVRPLVISLPQRAPALPSVPSALEEGIPEFRANSWVALFLPAATPDTVQSKLVAALDAVLDDNSTRIRLEELGATPAFTARRGPSYMTKFQEAQIILWRDFIARAGLKVD
jgi:tripartite-type tricarboxylate transporter receptor subunit TctC